MELKKLIDLEYLSKKYDQTNIPLYLSYPTTSFWKNPADESVFACSFKRENNPFLYFHFPYCKTACYYCCCYKKITKDENKKDTYIRYLKKEFTTKMQLLDVDRFLNVKHLHWGSGTPTYLTCNQIENVFSFIAERLEIKDTGDSSISIEAYPDDEVVSYKKLKLIRNLGFNEISFGIQDFDNRIQKTIGRKCEIETVKEIINKSKELGFRVHIDLCYGLPFQGLGEIENTIKYIIAMDPDRVSLFPYIHYPLQFPLQKKIPASSIPNSFIKVLLIIRAEELLTAYGYKKIGMDHFVKPDNSLYKASMENKIIKDFMGYSVDKRRSFIGFGFSAISLLGYNYFHNTTSLNEYYIKVDNGQLPLKQNTAFYLLQDDIIRNRIIQKSILCDFVIDKNEINRIFNIHFDEYFKKELFYLNDLEKDNLVNSTSKEKIFITSEGKHFSRNIAYIFDKYYQKKNYKQQNIEV